MEFCIGVQFVNRRLTMTGMWRVEPNSFLKIIQNKKCAKEGFRIRRRIYFFSHTEVHRKYLGTMQT